MAVAASGSVGETIAPSAKRGGPGETRYQRVSRNRDGTHRRRDKSEGQEGDRSEVGEQFPGGGEEGGQVEQGREKQHEDHIGRQLSLRQAGDESEHQASKNEEDRIRHIHQPGQNAQSGHGYHQRQK